MKDLLIIKILDKASDFIGHNKVLQLQLILEEELYPYELQQKVTALVPHNAMVEEIMLFLASKRLDGKAKTTIRAYSHCLARFQDHIHKAIQDVTAMDVRMFLAQLMKTGAKNSTMANNISILKSFFSWLENEDIINKNPMRKIQTTKVEKHLRKALTLEELEMLRIQCQSDRDKAIVEFFYSTGCRLNEALNLNKSDLQWSDGSVKVMGKGSKERVVYLNAKAKVYLWKYLNSRKDSTEALFVSENLPHARLGERAFQRTFNELGKSAGITKSVFPHLLRHTTGTVMLQSGASIVEVQSYLGHDNVSTTQIYAQLDDTAVKYSHKKHLA